MQKIVQSVKALVTMQISTFVKNSVAEPERARSRVISVELGPKRGPAQAAPVPMLMLNIKKIIKNGTSRDDWLLLPAKFTTI
jgi:hypothetical protein